MDREKINTNCRFFQGEVWQGPGSKFSTESVGIEISYSIARLIRITLPPRLTTPVDPRVRTDCQNSDGTGS